jgi:hypothetical protein
LNFLATEEIPQKDAESRATLRATIELLYKILNNIVGQPLEPKFRKISKAKEVLQKKIFKFKSAVNFLKVCQFTETSTDLELNVFDNPHLMECLEGIQEFIANMGGKTGQEFNPYQASFSKTTGEKHLFEILGLEKKEHKHVTMTEEMDAIKKERMDALEKFVEDREVTVFNNQNMNK